MIHIYNKIFYNDTLGSSEDTFTKIYVHVLKKFIIMIIIRKFWDRSRHLISRYLQQSYMIVWMTNTRSLILEHGGV